MNLFILNKDARIAARQNCDKHIVKIPLEAAEMLGYAFVENGIFFEPVPQINNIDLFPFKMHYNHPMSKWVRSSLLNYTWTIWHFDELLNEYTYRYDKLHSMEEVLKWISFNSHKLQFKFSDWTEPPRCFGKFKAQIPNSQDIAIDYQQYYKVAKRHIAKWKNREVPSWWS